MRLENRDERVTPPATVTQRPRLRFWTAHGAPSLTGRKLPKERTRRLRLTRWRDTCVLTRTATATVTGRLATLEAVVTTRSCVARPSLMSPKKKAPPASVE